ncbi:MAG: MBL fold metallo-hydrolase, partial [Endomicrobia bacterium]|nr:MBL fold metallo-hydrolase [Endomicrobiia bacterium]
ITAIFSSLLKVYFIDVNQGDASLIITPNNKVMLIDAGDIDEYYDYGEKVYRFIKQLNIDKIDIVLISHPHKDHIGGMYFILSKIKVGSFYDPGFPYPSEVYANLLELINEKQIKYNLARESTNINLDPSVDVKILHPPDKIVFDTPNDNSVVLRVRYKNISVLFTGDIEKKAEIEITNKYKNKPEKIMSNIIKVPHHGSITSSTENFIKLVSPEVAVISCGRNNRFGHPHKSVLQRYKNYGVEILRTDTDGTIEIVIDGNDYRIYSR